MMRWAVLAPTPGSVWSCATEAAFRLTGALGVARAALVADVLDFDVAVPPWPDLLGWGGFARLRPGSGDARYRGGDDEHNDERKSTHAVLLNKEDV